MPTVYPVQQHSLALHEPLPAVTVVVELAIVGPLVSPTLYFVTHVFFLPEPLYSAGINSALYGSQSAWDCGPPPPPEPPELPQLAPPPPAPEPMRFDTTIFFIELVIVNSFV